LNKTRPHSRFFRGESRPIDPLLAKWTRN